METRLPFRSPPETLCILRLSALGDVCNVVPVVRTLQKNWPQTRIAWVIGRLEHQLVGDIKGVEFIEYDKKSGLKGIFDLKKMLTGRQFSILLQMQAALRASLLSLAIPARIRLGFHPAMAKDFQGLFTNATTEAINHPHVIDGFFSFPAAMGLEQRELIWDIPIPEEAKVFVDRKIGTKIERYIIISPCASARLRNWRDWPVQKYARIIDYASRRYGIQTILTGGPTDNEKETGRRIRQRSTHKPMDLIGQTNIKQLLALIERSVAVIAPDSGPIHLANALGVPPIGLYASSNPLRTGPYRFQKWVVNAYPEAVSTAFGKSVNDISWGRRVRDPEAINLITMDEVMQKLDDLMRKRTLNGSK